MDILFEPANNDRLANLCGPLDEHLRQIEQRLGIEIHNRGNQFRLVGHPDGEQRAYNLLVHLYELSEEEPLTPHTIHLALQEQGGDPDRSPPPPAHPNEVVIQTRRGLVRGRGATQQLYLHQIQHHDLSFGVGPAGTGKTYLAVASAVAALEQDRVRRIVLTRPAVEAGERLGFLPGDLAQKVDPYLRPLYDALYEMLGFEKVAKLMERHVIEVAPLAYMRGRTLNESFIILDEAQNTTPEQMKMLLTRIGFGSVAVVTGDLTQMDLPRGSRSGLNHALEVLESVRGIAITRFTAQDVVRHPLVQKIVTAYERAEAHHE